MKYTEFHTSFMDLTDQALWVVTAGNLESPAGLIATSVSQLSISPRCIRYVVVLAKPHYTCQCAQQSQALTLHLFDELNLDFVERFGTKHGPDLSKFSGLDLEMAPNGGVVITAAPAWGAGQIYQQLDLGDRIAFFVTIKQQSISRKFQPLTWNRFKQLASPELLQLLEEQLTADQLRDDEILRVDDSVKNVI